MLSIVHDAPGRAWQVRRRAPDGVPAVVAVLPYSEHPGSAMSTPQAAQRLAERVAALLLACGGQDDIGAPAAGASAGGTERDVALGLRSAHNGPR